MADLLSCPFCGAMPVVRRSVEEYPSDEMHPAGEFDARFAICCDECGIEVSDEYRNMSITAWNRRAADAGTAEPVAIKPLEWVDQRGHSFPDKWDVRTPCGVYEIEERSASDSPAYVVTGPFYVFIADKDSLDEAKEAAQADFERRIRSVLITPSPDAITTAREAGRHEGLEEAARIAERVGNFGDYARDELTANYGQPRFDMMHAILTAIRGGK